MAGLIRDYLTELEGRLAFDEALRLRARAEVQAHLRDALDDETGPDREAAERRVVGRFGPAEEIAAGLLLATRPKRIRQALLLAGLLVLQLFLFMRLRASGAAEPVAADPALVTAVLLDRIAFVGAMATGLAGAAMLTWGSAARLRIGIIACATATTGLAVSVVTGGFIAFSVAAHAGTGPALALASATPIEALLLVLLAVQLRRLHGYARACGTA